MRSTRAEHFAKHNRQRRTACLKNAAIQHWKLDTYALWATTTEARPTIVTPEWRTSARLAMTPAGLKPAIPGSVSRCLIHWATGPLAKALAILKFDANQDDGNYSLRENPSNHLAQASMAQLVRERCFAPNQTFDLEIKQNTHRRARTHAHKVKSLELCRLS